MEDGTSAEKDRGRKAEELIAGLRRISEGMRGLAIDLRTANPGLSYRAFKVSEVCRESAEALGRMIPMEPEIEGGGSNWWRVCPECHGSVWDSDPFCRHCGQALKRKEAPKDGH